MEFLAIVEFHELRVFLHDSFVCVCVCKAPTRKFIVTTLCWLSNWTLSARLHWFGRRRSGPTRDEFVAR